MKNPLFINEKIWKEFTDEELDENKKKIFDFYRQHGFPYFDMTDEECSKVFDNLLNFDSDRVLIEDNKLKQIVNGLNLVNNFMPHIFEVKCHNFISPLTCFNNDLLLKKAIEKRIKYGGNMSHAGMRKTLSWTHGTHRVSNFRPTIAKYIYDNYSGDGRVLDFSSGFGGRLFGAFVSQKVKTYVGTDPSTKTYEGLIKIKDYLQTKIEKEVILHNQPFEDLELEDNSFDLAFSSPPYFNTEEYSYEDTQSFIKYDTKEKWRDGFLKPLVSNVHRYLKTDGYFLMNIANVRTYENLESDFLEIANEQGFKLIKTYKIQFGKIMADGFKYEPIFVFKKV